MGDINGHQSLGKVEVEIMRPEVKAWLEKADSDLNAAEYNLEGNLLDIASFCCQQAAEKALKAVYISRFGELWKVHDLVELARRLKAPSNIIELCAVITPAYTATRYLDVEKIYDKNEVKQLLQASKEVVKWTKKKLKL